MIRKTWRDYRVVRRALSPRRLVPTVLRDIRSGRLTVGEVASTTVKVMLDLDPPRHPPAPDPVEDHRRAARDRHDGPRQL